MVIIYLGSGVLVLIPMKYYIIAKTTRYNSMVSYGSLS